MTGDASPSRRAFAGYKYDWKGVHADLLESRYAGVYGWDHAAYWGIAEKKAGVNLEEFYKRRSEAEFYLPEWQALIDDPATQEHWKRIVTFDPLGFYGMPPTVASCRATLTIPELMDLNRDGVIVDADGGIKCSKAAVSYAWNVPHLAERLGLTEKDLREALAKYSGSDKILDPKIRTFLPAVGGFTIYAFGDVRKIRDPATEIAVRVHDECIGSDVFGSDICTCRPYLMFAMKHAVECAQRGGVGLVIYYRKEGRSLGEVVKFRVYNARTNQAGGDRPETYFLQTESIAGIRDARFQTMMPDALSWLGITRIDWLLSMSADKYDAIVDAGIQVMQRVSLPDDWVPKSAWVELDAKVASGYHAMDVDKHDLIEGLNKLEMIRERCGKIFALAEKRQLSHFVYDESKLNSAIDFVEQVVRTNYANLEIPNHSRMRHFRSLVIDPLIASWSKKTALERTRRLVDLCTVSVVMDAGAGANWKYVCPFEGKAYTRSEGIAQATVDMFAEGVFSSDPAVKCRVNSVGLLNLKIDDLRRGFHIRQDNVIVGLEGRLGLLQRLGQCMESYPEFFGPDEVFRPGNVVDYVMRFANDKNQVSVKILWEALAGGLKGVWPSSGSGVKRGDVWMHNKLKNPMEAGSDLIPFHKLTQWLAYTIIDVMENNLGVVFTDQNQLTALAEYRNGGLLVDTGVLQLKDPKMATFGLHAGSELVVEWRALTVILIDKIAQELCKRLGKDLTMSQVLEGGTWRAGRELANKLRPSQGLSPIIIESDGTVF